MNATIETTETGMSAMGVKPARPKILLVDDDPAVRQILVRLLEDEDYFVRTAANGVEALALVHATRFDLALLDLNMPVRDGWETFIQLSTQNPGLPIILITARAGQFFPALASGVDALLEKPLDFVKLFHTIRELLEEPPEVRLERFLGRPPALRLSPPIPAKPEWITN